MKHLSQTIAVMVMIIGIVATASASPVYIDTLGGNDPSSPSKDLTSLEATVSSWLGLSDPLDLEFYAKVEFPDTTTTEGSGNLTLTYALDGQESKAGTWTAEDDINLFSIKAGSQYALYWLNPATDFGEWSTAGVDNHGISHFSAWIVKGGYVPPTNPVPEPSTMLLLGLGLLALTGLSRKAKKERIAVRIG